MIAPRGDRLQPGLHRHCFEPRTTSIESAQQLTQQQRLWMLQMEGLPRRLRTPSQRRHRIRHVIHRHGIQLPFQIRETPQLQTSLQETLQQISLMPVATTIRTGPGAASDQRRSVHGHR